MPEERLFVDSRGCLALAEKPKMTFFLETPDLRGIVLDNSSVVRLTDSELEQHKVKLDELGMKFYAREELVVLDYEKKITIETLALIGRANFNQMLDLSKRPSIPVELAQSGY